MCDSVKTSVEKEVATCGMDHDLSECFELIDPFDGLRTEYQQVKFYRKEFELVVRKFLHNC